MRHGFLLGTVLSLTAFGVAGCGSDSETPAARGSREASAPTPSELTQLVPQDAFVFLRFASLDELQTSVRGLVAAVDAQAAQDLDVTALLSEFQLLPGDASLVARDRPLGVAASFPAQGGMPAPTFIVPATDAAAYVASIPAAPGAAAPVTRGDYVGITLGPAAATDGAAPAITKGLPGGFVSARVDLTRVLATYRPMIEMGLAQGKQLLTGAMEQQNATGLDMAAMAELYFGAFRQVLDSAETLDLGLASETGDVAFEWALKVAEGSPMASFSSQEPVDLRELAGYLDASSPVAAVFGADMPALMDRLQPSVDPILAIYPPPLRHAMTGLMEDARPLLPLVGSVVAADGAFDEDGMRFVYFLQPTDAEALEAGYMKMMRSERMAAIGFSPDTVEEAEVGGVRVTSLHFALDTEAMAGAAGLAEADEARMAAFQDIMTSFYGEEGLRLRMATVGDRMVMALGGDDTFLAGALTRINGKSSAPMPGLARAIDRIGGASPCFAYHLDLARLISDASMIAAAMPQAMPPEMPELPPDASAPMTVYGAIDGRVWRGGALMDLAGFAQVVRAMEGQ